MSFCELSSPLLVQFELTFLCNNDCSFCYNCVEKSIDSSPRYDDVIYTLNELYELGVYNIVFTGGEPFLYPHFLNIVRIAKDLGFDVFINTNGRLIDTDTASFLKEVGINNVSVSLISSEPEQHDSLTNCTNSWSETIIGIKNLVQNGVNTNINVPLAKSNLKYLDAIAKMSKDLGTTLSITRLIPTTKKQLDFELSLKELSILKDKIKNIEKSGVIVDIFTPLPICSSHDLNKDINACTAGITTCVISPELDVRPCPFLKANCGNLTNKGLKDIWKSKKMKMWRDISSFPEYCINCSIFSLCRAGCRQSSLMHKDKIDPLICTKPNYFDAKGFNLKKSNSAQMKKNNLVKLADCFERANNTRYRREDFGLVITNSRNKPLFLKGSTSIFIWDVLCNKMIVEDIIGKITEQFTIDKESATEDILNFLTILYCNGMIKEVTE